MISDGDVLQWRQENGVNTVCNEDLSKTFEEGKQEVFLLPPDKKGRPVIVYRSGIHFPGKVPNKDFARFVLQVGCRNSSEKLRPHSNKARFK